MYIGGADGLLGVATLLRCKRRYCNSGWYEERCACVDQATDGASSTCQQVVVVDIDLHHHTEVSK